jgi:hypothetical protein
VRTPHSSLFQHKGDFSMTILFLIALIAAIASIVLLPMAKGGARSVLVLVAVVAAGTMVFLLTGGHVL